jgi:diguanylate cyclase (GGDEF)-like protein
VAARLAGDEFILFIANVSSTKMIDDAIENIFQNLTALVNIEGIMLTPTFSMGVSVYPDDSSSIEKLYHQADIAMYYAKKQQGNIYYYFSAIDSRSSTPSTTE